MAKLYLIDNNLDMKRYTFFLTFLTIIIICTSCSQKIYKEYNLFQKGLDSLQNFEYKDVLIQNNDVLNVQIFSATLSQDQAAIFSMGAGGAGGSTSASGAASSTSGNSGGVSYQVDLSGNITMPIIGKIKSTGRTQDQITKDIVSKLEPIIKDPVVTVNLTNIKVNVLGEVKAPGIKSFNKYNPTFLDALGQAGDFTDRAKRNEVYLIRDINGKRTTYKINMNDVSVFTSEAFQLIQNDVIYVPADDIKLKSVNQDPDFQKKAQIASVAAQIVSAIAIVLNTFLLLKKL